MIKTKITRLEDLNEKSLIENVLIPLLNRMGYKAATIYHGHRERGKDIICFDYDRLGGREYLAVVAKAADLNGSVSSCDSLREIVYQIEQCFDVPYEDLFGMTRITMDRVWVVTSRRIVSGAADSIFEHLTKRNLAKLVRFISGENLIQLIDDHYPSYWESSIEPLDEVNKQRDRLIRFCKKILISLGGDPSDVESTINNVIHSALPPSVSPSPDKSLARVSPYRVEFDSIDEEYSHGFFSTNCGLIRDAFFKAKESIYYAMFDVDEIMEHYEEVIKKTNPKEFTSAFEEKLSDYYPFWRSSFGRASDARQEIEYLDDGLSDIDQLKEDLQKIGKLEWAKSLVDSVSLLENEISSFLNHIDKEIFTLSWNIDVVSDKPKVRLLYDSSDTKDKVSFVTEHKKEIEYYRRWQHRSKKSITLKDIMEDVQYKLRLYLDNLIEEHSLEKEDDT